MIHQTWRDVRVPDYLAPLQRSWRRHHPGWEYRLWTDADNRRLISEHYPRFLETYDGYPLAIQRADAARYFILDRHGGLYVDLDFESLRPVEEALGAHGCVLGTEPDRHAAMHRRPKVVANALMASVRGHPLWSEVHRALVERRHARNERGEACVLNSTGPLMLTDVVADRPVGDVFIHPPNVFYPLLDATNLGFFGGWNAEGAARRDAYLAEAAAGRWPADSVAVHHWSGTWWHLRDEKKAIIEALTHARRDPAHPASDA
ncbi:MAG TPA: glycosyltransferase [Longimicrobiales bacterium]